VAHRQVVTLASNLLPRMPPTEQEKASAAASAATSAAAAAAAAAACAASGSRAAGVYPEMQMIIGLHIDAHAT